MKLCPIECKHYAYEEVGDDREPLHQCMHQFRKQRDCIGDGDVESEVDCDLAENDDRGRLVLVPLNDLRLIFSVSPWLSDEALAARKRIIDLIVEAELCH